jgi:hypothetical protein
MVLNSSQALDSLTLLALNSLNVSLFGYKSGRASSSRAVSLGG